MRLFLFLFLSLPAWADSSFVVVREMPIYVAPDFNSQVLLRLRPGESANFTTATDGNFYHIWVRRAGKWRYGFASKSIIEDALLAPVNRHAWSVGLGADAAYYWQNGRTFQTDDQVQYTTTQYRGNTIAPTLNFQIRQRDFWRVCLSYRQIVYRTEAATSLIGAVPQSAVLQQNLYSAVGEKAWNPLTIWPELYGGVGVEMAKASSVSLTLGGTVLPTTAEDNPVYLGLILFVGDQWLLTQSWSVFFEGRYEMVLNQSPTINAFGASVGLSYWP